MHELGIAQDFWAVIKQNAEANKLKTVTKIVITVGEASGIDIDFLKHSFNDHILPGSFAQGAELEFVSVPLSAHCNDCGATITKETITGLCCPGCGGSHIEVVAGRETYVQSIEGE